MSTLETNDGSKCTFFIAGSIGLITDLKDLCHVLKITFSRLHRHFFVLSDNTGYCHLTIAMAFVNNSFIADGFNVNVSIVINKYYEFKRRNGAWNKCCC